MIGGRGFVLLTPLADFEAIGKCSGHKYQFKAGESRYVDKRDMPGLPRELLRKDSDA